MTPILVCMTLVRVLCTVASRLRRTPTGGVVTARAVDATIRDGGSFGRRARAPATRFGAMCIVLDDARLHARLAGDELKAAADTGHRH